MDVESSIGKEIYENTGVSIVVLNLLCPIAKYY